MKIKVNYWLVVVVAAAVLLGSGLALAASLPVFDTFKASLSNIFSPRDDEAHAGVTVDVEEKGVADEEPDPVVGGKSKVNSSTYTGTPLISQTPWGQGPSDQKDASPNQTPWQQGPSQ